MDAVLIDRDDEYILDEIGLGDQRTSANRINYHYELDMSLRGWRSYPAVGQSSNPHGGVGSLLFMFGGYD